MKNKIGSRHEPVVSICIPTHDGRLEMLKNTLDSIYSQNADDSLFEICISDNSSTNEIECFANNHFSKYASLVYKKSACEGYLNSVEVLKLGKGKFLKLHNDYSKFKKGSFQKFINRILENEGREGALFFSSGSLTDEGECLRCGTFDEFINKLSYHATWSSSFGIWKEDFDFLMRQDIKLDKMFPHVSILYALNKKSEYVIDNVAYFDNQTILKKGGYNLPEVFGYEYIQMNEDLLKNGHITKATFDFVRLENLDFISNWYAMSKYNKKYCAFDFSDAEKWLSHYYAPGEISSFYTMARKYSVKIFIRKLLYLPLLALRKARQIKVVSPSRVLLSEAFYAA